MTKKYSLSFFASFILLVTAFMYGCEKDFVAQTPAASKSFVEEFDTVANLYSKGWVFVNNSKPIGAATWQQGVFGKLTGGFPAFSFKSAADEYAFAGYSSGNGLANISSWMLTPPIEMKNGDKFSFYTRTVDVTFPDRLQVRLNPTDASTEVGLDSNSVGKFTTLFVDINPNLTNAYPTQWTKYEFTISGLPAPVKRRIGFRYYVQGGGPLGSNSNAIGIDQFSFQSL